MSILKEIILSGAIGLAAIVSGCGVHRNTDANNQAKAITPDYYKQGIEKITTEFGIPETITTQITDVQDGFIVSVNGQTTAFKYVHVKGGDSPKGLVLIYPNSQYFEKYVPAKVTFRRITNSKITARLFNEKFVHERCNTNDEFNYIITADGLIEPEGVEYIEEKK